MSEMNKTAEILVTKRSGELVKFDPNRIKEAIQKATQSSGQSAAGENIINDIVKDVTDEITIRFTEDFIPNVENIQDIVEKNLMKAQMFDIAKSYILYRAQRQKARDDQRKKKSFLRKLSVVKRSGRTVLFNYNKLRATVERCAGEDQVCVEPILEETVKNIYDGISTDDIGKALVLAASSLIEKNTSYDRIAAKLFLQNIRYEIFGQSIDSNDLEIHYKSAFMAGIEQGVTAGRLDPYMLEFNLEQLSEAIDITRDNSLTYQSTFTLYERYLLQVKGNRVEMPQCFWMRVAMGLAMREENKEESAIEFYNVLSQLRFVSSTPTLFHSGMPNPQLSSCYLTTVSDDLNHIFEAVSDNAQLSKWSGGLGNDWTNIRGTGSWINSTNVTSQGVVPFLKIADSTTAAINRSGKRRGATCAYLETWHYDVEDFLDLRKNTGDERRRTHDMNTANWIPDLFMERVKAGEKWTLFSPDEVPDLHDLYGNAFKEKYEFYEALADHGKIKLFKKVEAKKLWRKMLTMLFETGHPWLCWKDSCNIRSPQDHVGVVHSSNLCTEITLNTSASRLVDTSIDDGYLVKKYQLGEVAVCNIGSINYAAHIKNGKLDRKMLRKTVASAIRMLDNVIDDNFYPTPESKNSNLKHRPIGLGVMGFQDLLFKLNLPFDSEEAVDLSDSLQELISYEAIYTSSRLAKEKGSYATYKGSKWDRGLFPYDTLKLLAQERGCEIPEEISMKKREDWDFLKSHVKKYGMRNSNVMAIAPTATISTIAGCWPSIEPIYSNIFVKSNISGEFTVPNHYLVKALEEAGLWDQEMLDDIKYHDGSIQMIDNIPDDFKKIYKGVFEIDPKWVIRHAAVRNKWIDQSQSVNIWIKGASGKTLNSTYLYAWSMLLKTTYYLRTLAASQVEKSTLDSGKYGFTQKRNNATEVKACRLDNPDCESCQ